MNETRYFKSTQIDWFIGTNTFRVECHQHTCKEKQFEWKGSEKLMHHLHPTTFTYIMRDFSCTDDIDENDFENSKEILMSEVATLIWNTNADSIVIYECVLQQSLSKINKIWILRQGLEVMFWKWIALHALELIFSIYTTSVNIFECHEAIRTVRSL